MISSKGQDGEKPSCRRGGGEAVDHYHVAKGRGGGRRAGEWEEKTYSVHNKTGTSSTQIR